MVLLIYFVLDYKFFFWANLAQKMKITSLYWNLVFRLTRIWRIQWWCSFFVYFWLEVFFRENMFQEFKNICWSWNFETETNSNIWKLMAVFFSFLDRKYPFLVNLVQKFKFVALTWNLVLRLLRICKILWWCSLFVF